MPTISENIVKKNVEPAAVIRSFSTSCNNEWNNELDRAFVEFDSLEQRISCRKQNFGKTANQVVSWNSAKAFFLSPIDEIDTLSETMSNQRIVNTKVEEDSVRYDDASLSTSSSSDCNLNSSSPAFSVVSSSTQSNESAAPYHGNNAEALYSRHCDKKMNNVCEMLLNSFRSTLAPSVIPAQLLTKSFYVRKMVASEADYARSHLRQYFVAAVKINSDHWLCFRLDSDGMLHFYDFFGNEEHYKKILDCNFKEVRRRLKGQLKHHYFDDNNYFNMEKKKHSIQQDSAYCRPLVLQEDGSNDILTDAEFRGFCCRRFDSLLQFIHFSDLRRYGVNYSCSKSDNYYKVFLAYTESKDDEAASTSTKDVMNKSNALAAHSQVSLESCHNEWEDVLDQAMNKNYNLRQKDVCNSKAEANRTILNSSEALVAVYSSDSDVVSNSKPTVDQSKVNATTVGGGTEKEIASTCPYLESLIGYGSNIIYNSIPQPPPPQFGNASELWNYCNPLVLKSLQLFGTLSYTPSTSWPNRIEVVLDSGRGRFLASANDLLNMKLQGFDGNVMDIVMKLLLRRSNYSRARHVIPPYYATHLLYEGKIFEEDFETIDKEDFENAKLWLTESFITAINVHSSFEHRKSGGKRNHWIFLSRDSRGILHVYDPNGNEQYYKKTFIQPLFSKLYKHVTGKFEVPKFDDELYGSSIRKEHFVQERGCTCCGAIVLREAERWLFEEVTPVFTDAKSCAFYRERYVDLLLKHTSLDELMHYCVGCHCFIDFDDIKNSVQCVECRRRLHCKESCIKLKFEKSSPFTCASCQLIMQLRNKQAFDSSETPVPPHSRNFNDTTPFQKGLNSVATVIRRRNSYCLKRQSRLNEKMSNARRYQPYRKHRDVGDQMPKSALDELASLLYLYSSARESRSCN